MTIRTLPFFEFILLIAIMFAMIAFGSDAMLPAFPQIAADLGLSDVNRAQLVITIFILGTGLGQLFTGPLSDALGRKPVILGGLLVYMAGSALAIYANSLSMLLLARFIQGVGVSAPRTVTIAMVRDLYAGRRMARVMSLAMTLFVLVPAVAPLIGQSIAASFGWRAIFGAFILFAIFGALWLGLRQPETLPREKRRALKIKTFMSALIEVCSSRVVITYSIVLAFGYGALFGYLSSAQQVFVDTFGAGDDFPLYFALIAVISGGAGFLNAGLVIRFGMRPIATFAFGFMFVITAGLALLTGLTDLSNDVMFPIFLLWSVIGFFIPGLTFGNLTALTMEPMGHIAGVASAIVGAMSTLLGVLIAIPIGLAFDGTALPLMIGAAICSAVSFALMLSNPKDA